MVLCGVRLLTPFCCFRIRKQTADREMQKIRNDNLQAEHASLSSTIESLTQTLSSTKLAALSEKQNLESELSRVSAERISVAAELEVCRKQLAEAKQALEAVTGEASLVQSHVTAASYSPSPLLSSSQR